MSFLDRVKAQLAGMLEAEKDVWILTQAKLTGEERQRDFLQSLSGEKKILDMPSEQEIREFCEKAERGEIYFEYETHYCEFDGDGSYMDDWKVWYHDPLRAADFLDRVLKGCRDLVKIGEYREAEQALSMVLGLKFQVRTAEESEDDAQEELFSVTDAEAEQMLSISLSEAGGCWLRAAARLQEGQGCRGMAGKLIQILEYPACKGVKPRQLKEEMVPQEVFLEMAAVLERETAELEKKRTPGSWSREQYWLNERIGRKRGLLLDIRVKCLERGAETEGLEDGWARILELTGWLDWEKGSAGLPEAEEVRELCGKLARSEKTGREPWEVRRKILGDMIQNHYYARFRCEEDMEKLEKRLCMGRTERLALAGMLEKSEEYGERAERLYYELGRDDKYAAYLELHLGKGSWEYAALIAYYQRHGRQEDAWRTARLGLENCREDLTDCFICLLLKAKWEGDQEAFKKLYASAKRRKKVNLARIERALEEENEET